MAFYFTLHPAESMAPIEVLEVNGFELNINGQYFNFSALPPGGRISVLAINNPYLNPHLGKVFTPEQRARMRDYITREGDTIHAGLALPWKHPAPLTTKFPDPILIENNGRVLLPGRTLADEWS